MLSERDENISKSIKNYEFPLLWERIYNIPTAQEMHDSTCSTMVFFTVYIYYDSKLLAPVVCFTELVETGLFAVWAEQHSASFTLFLTRTAWKESIVPKLNIG